MARIRTIKPEFFTSEDIIKLSPFARLFYIGLWCEADRIGRLNWKPLTLKFRYLPADNVEINEISEELISAKLLNVYEVDGEKYAEIPKFIKHQIINVKEAQSKLPGLNSQEFTEIHMNSCEFTEKSTGKGKERKGKEGKENTREDFLNILSSIDADLLSADEKQKRFAAIESEFRNWGTWHDQVSIAIRKTQPQIKKLIITFLHNIRADNDYFKDINEIRKHFRNWANKQPSETQTNVPVI